MNSCYLSVVSALVLVLSALGAPVSAEDKEPPLFKWRKVEIAKISIGYGVQLTDVDGDKKTDIVLCDKKTIQWYQNPSCEKHIIARDLTKRDNV